MFRRRLREIEVTAQDAEEARALVQDQVLVVHYSLITCPNSLSYGNFKKYTFPFKHILNSSVINSYFISCASVKYNLKKKKKKKTFMTETESFFPFFLFFRPTH